MKENAITITPETLQKETDEQVIPENSPIEMSGREMDRTLDYCGYTNADFARYIKRSHTFVNRSLRSSQNLPPRYVQELENLVTTENLQESLYRIRTGKYRKYLTGSEMRKLIIKQGYTFKEVADFIHRTGPFVSDILGSKVHSIPLRYIDALRAMFTPKYYDAELQKIRQK